MLKQPMAKLTRNFDGITIKPAFQNQPSSTEFELKNASRDWIAYKLKCSHSVNFTVKPNACGLVPPNGIQTLLLNLLPYYNRTLLTKVDLLLETMFIDKTDDTSTNVALVWEDATKQDITSTRFPILITEFASKVPMTVCLDKYPNGVEKTGANKLKSVLDRMRRDDVVAFTILFFTTLFLVAFFLGYLANRSVNCTCPASSMKMRKKYRF